MNILELMKNANKAKAMFAEKQQAQANAIYHGEAGAGWVKVTMKGDGSIKDIELADDVLKEEKQILIELLIAAVNDCNNKMSQQQKDDLSSLGELFGGMGGMGDIMGGGQEEKG